MGNVAVKQPPASSASTVVLATGASGNSADVPCLGAVAVHFSVRADVNHQLSACNLVLTMTDGRTITTTPGAFANGVNVTGVPVQAIGQLTTLDLSSATPRGTYVRSGDAALLGGIDVPMLGVQSARLAMTKVALAGDATYTVTATVYN